MSKTYQLANEFVLAFLGALERCVTRVAALLDPMVQAARRRFCAARGV